MFYKSMTESMFSESSPVHVLQHATYKLELNTQVMIITWTLLSFFLTGDRQ
jgi:hypothetical protein